MAEKVNQTKNFENKYDNADLQADRTTKDIAAAYTQYDEMRAYREYLETLKLEAEMGLNDKKVMTRVLKADGTYDELGIEVRELIPQQSEFEQARRRIIKKLNAVQKDAGGSAKMKQLYADFETDSIFELSSKITNYQLDHSRRTKMQTQFALY